MATRSSALNQFYSRTMTLGSISAFTIAGWINVRVNNGGFSTFWNIDNASTSDVTVFQTGTDGLSFDLASDAGPYVTGPTCVLNQWIWFGVIWTGNGGTATMIYRRETDTAFTTVTGTIPSTQTATRLRLLDSAWGGEWLNGSIAAVKLWTAALTAPELEREFFTYQPSRAANLLFWSPFLTPGTADHSGFGSTLTATGTLTLDPAGPPIAWGGSNNRIVLPLAPTTITATISGTLPGFTGSITETSRDRATISGTLPSLTASITETSRDRATMAGTLPGVSGALTESSKASATMAGTLPGFSGALSASLSVSATMVGTFPSVTGVLASEAILTASISGDLPGLAGSVAVDAYASAEISGTLPAVTASFALGPTLITATISGDLPSVTGSITADAYVSAEISGALPAVTATFEARAVYRALSAVLDGPGAVVHLLDGPALVRAVEGVGIERVVTGVTRHAHPFDGPSTATSLLDGPAVGHDVTGPATERILTGVGI